MNGKFDNTETGEKYEVLILIKGYFNYNGEYNGEGVLTF